MRLSDYPVIKVQEELSQAREAIQGLVGKLPFLIGEVKEEAVRAGGGHSG